ncbi:MAG: hypothetical protein H8K11_07230 [Nitrospira sp.]|nr:hypothetical protein [Nitrospira sp.]
MIQACEKVKIGDTEEKVRELMGKPMDVTDVDVTKMDSAKSGEPSAHRKLLTYPAPAIVPSTPQISIDGSGHVDEVTCYESHRLKKDQGNPPQSIRPSTR